MTDDLKLNLNSDALLEVAREASKSPLMDAAAEKVRATAVAKALQRSDTGEFADSITVTEDDYRGVRDRVIHSTDEGAIPIEFGWVTEGGTAVPGLQVFQETAREFR